MKSLRERAENELKTLDDSQEKSVLNAQKLIYELEVSQVELKMQNEELQSAQTEITQLKDTYQELYDDAPVGYLTLNQNGLIETSNLKGAQFLDLPKDQLVGQPLQKSILKAHQDRFRQSEHRDPISAARHSRGAYEQEQKEVVSSLFDLARGGR